MSETIKEMELKQKIKELENTLEGARSMHEDIVKRWISPSDIKNRIEEILLILWQCQEDNTHAQDNETDPEVKQIYSNSKWAMDGKLEQCLQFLGVNSAEEALGYEGYAQLRTKFTQEKESFKKRVKELSEPFSS